MRHGKVRPISSAPLRLDPRVLRQAEELARSAGVTVPELIEVLLLGLLDSDAAHVVAPPRACAPRPAVTANRGSARVIPLEPFRRRRASPTEAGTAERHLPDLRARVCDLRRRAAAARARSVRVREAARRARETARAALDELRGIGVVVS